MYSTCTWPCVVIISNTCAVKPPIVEIGTQNTCIINILTKDTRHGPKSLFFTCIFVCTCTV